MTHVALFQRQTGHIRNVCPQCSARSCSAKQCSEPFPDGYHRWNRRDYRWEEWPGESVAATHPHDCSMMSYRGHSVLQTLIRAYISPAEKTGQRYIYAGSACGSIFVWGVLPPLTLNFLALT